jgi:hypothetical protein
MQFEESALEERTGSMDDVKGIASGISAELQRLLLGQRKTQRANRSLLVATILDVRSANLMDLAVGLPRDVDRIDMRYQRIARVLMSPLIELDAVMVPFGREVLEHLASHGEPLVPIMDQSKLNDCHQVLMLAVRQGERALLLLWGVRRRGAALITSLALPHHDQGHDPPAGKINLVYFQHFIVKLTRYKIQDVGLET